MQSEDILVDLEQIDTSGSSNASNLTPLYGKNHIYENELTKLKNILRSSEHTMSPNTISSLLYRLCSFKLYEPLVIQIEKEKENEGEDLSESKRLKKLRLVKQHSVIQTVWTTVVNELKHYSSTITSSLDNMRNTIDDENLDSVYHNIIQIFKMLMDYYENVKDIIKFFHFNYPTVIQDEFPLQLDELEYYQNIALAPLFLEHGDKVRTGFTKWFLSANSAANFQYSKLQLEFMKYLYRSNPILQGEPFTECLNTCILSFANEIINDIQNNQDDSTNGLNIIITGLKKLVLICWPLGKDIIPIVTEFYIENTLLKEYTAASIIRRCVENCDIKDSGDQIIYKTILECFLDRDLEDLLKDEISYAFEDSLKYIFESVKNYSSIKYFIMAVKYINFISNSTIETEKVKFSSFSRIIRESIFNFLGGDIKVVEKYQKLISLRMKGLSTTHFQLASEDMDTLLCKIPYFLQFDKSFLLDHSNYLFRRIVMSGPRTLNDLSQNSFEHNLLKTYDEIYQHNDDATGFLNFSLDMRGACSMANEYMNLHGEEIDLALVPMVFAKKSVPKIFQNTNIDQDIIIPDRFKESWNTFSSFYKAKDKNEYKTLHQMYSLHHCEVETFYKLPNGENLTFQLTLYQTLILEKFNELDELTVNHIRITLNMTVDTVLIILQSFLNIHLIKASDKDTYILNNNYSPDLKKVKNSRLRIQLPKTTSSINQKDTHKLKTLKNREGNLSLWKLELIKAAIVRTVKTHPDRLQFDELIDIVNKQVHDYSVGEFKDALYKTVLDGAIRQEEHYYIY
ncbi:hypothetical protein TPHA_0O01340 [Tetrapisispora phaffii CBS 4417]|uniref:Cullin family profile domain-containing protein n=1 Tax=Tetrapisispora phaffii (strain ATCC 24235 / CBS 4417 / NBRC 1672 / NRRL Y-8282 / UCD 70-5) TaxID=1071381 RepID=G8C1S4_TETPH|nr:hypothetical protein TPHA_0O01340 [Tetrapisispora phaffii CBS 4417]CCE66102.1 hypothetical protein TPHA_0O01340 [Tetrapisispora phaffii CBS 4417]